MKKVWIALAVVVLVGGGWLLLRSRAPKVKLLTSEVMQGPLDATVSATGTVNPVIMVQVGSQISGTVQRLYADYNSVVHKGQVLLELDPSIYQAQLAQALANGEKAHVTMLDAQRAYKRAKELFAQNFVSKADCDAAETAFEGSKASEKQARASVELARVNLNHCTITSPIDGVVISRSVDVGQTVAASLQSPELFRIANNLHDMQVETSIDEADIGKLQVGQPVSFTVDAFPENMFPGRIKQIRSQAITQQNVVTYVTVIEVENPELKLRPGMTANVAVLYAHRDQVLKVPNAALRFRPQADMAAKFGLKPEDLQPGGRGGTRGGMAMGAGMGGASAGGQGGRSSSEQPMRGGAAGMRHGAMDSSASRGGSAWAPGGMRGSRTPPARVFVQTADGKLRAVTLRTGLSDGSFTEILKGELKAGEKVAISLEGGARSTSGSAPPGLGGPGGFGGGGRR